MNFESPLVEGRLIKRYKRFLADVELASGECVTAHCPNSGSMLGVSAPTSPVWLRRNEDPKRRTPYTWELIEVESTLVCVHTTQANRVVEEALLTKKIAPLAPYSSVRREVAYGTNARIDFLLQCEGLPDYYLEVKSVTLKREGIAQFPDAVTARGTKHMGELAKTCEMGARAGVLYLVQRGDARAFCLADDIDPAYAKASALAHMAGVERMCYICDVKTSGVVLTHALPIIENK